MQHGSVGVRHLHLRVMLVNWRWIRELVPIFEPQAHPLKPLLLLRRCDASVTWSPCCCCPPWHKSPTLPFSSSSSRATSSSSNNSDPRLESASHCLPGAAVTHYSSSVVGPQRDGGGSKCRKQGRRRRVQQECTLHLHALVRHSKIEIQQTHHKRQASPERNGKTTMKRRVLFSSFAGNWRNGRRVERTRRERWVLAKMTASPSRMHPVRIRQQFVVNLPLLKKVQCIPPSRNSLRWRVG